MTNEQKIAFASVIGQVAGITVGAIIRHAKAIKAQGGSAVVNARKQVETETDLHNRSVFIDALVSADIPPLTVNQELLLLQAVTLRAGIDPTSGSYGVAKDGSKVVGIDALRLGIFIEEGCAFLGLGLVSVVKHLPAKANVSIVKLAALPAMLSAARNRM